MRSTTAARHARVNGACRGGFRRKDGQVGDVPRIRVRSIWFLAQPSYKVF